MRIGLIADTHIPINARELPLSLAIIFAGVELILHAGDIYLPSVLDELGELAPVFAAYGDGDERMRTRPGAHPSLKKSHIINVDGIRIGLVHNAVLSGTSLEKTFGSAVDVAVIGHTHQAKVETYQDVLVVNPGSATLPDHQENRKGTVALLDIEAGDLRARIVHLE